MNRYKLLEADSLSELEKEIQQYVNLGYKLLSVSTMFTGGALYTAAMELEELNDEN